MSMNHVRSRIVLTGLALAFSLALIVSANAIDTKKIVEVPISDAPSFAKRALVIGVNDYTIAQPLTACGNDARDFAHMLETRLGFEHVAVMTDDPGTPKALIPNGTNIRHQLRLLLNGVVPDKTEIVLFYSGHGTRTRDAQTGDADWLVPEDGDPNDIAHSCINYSEFKSQLDTARPARALLVMDACRDLFAGKGVGPSGFGSDRVAQGPQIAEMLSCQPTQVSREGNPKDFKQSVFTHFLIKGLEGDPDATADAAHTLVTFDSLKTYVQGEVSQYVSDNFNDAQLPAGQATLGGMVLARRTTATVTPEPAPTPKPVKVAIVPPAPVPPTPTPAVTPQPEPVKPKPKAFENAKQAVSSQGYELTVPSDWTIKENAIQGIDLAIIGPAMDAFADNVNVVLQSIPDGYSLNDAQAQVHQGYPQMFPEYKLISEKMTKVDGVSAYRFACTYTTEDPYRHLRMQQVMVIKNGQGYVFTSTQSVDAHNDHDKILTAILDSIKWAKG